jgi:hypothetical protein
VSYSIIYIYIYGAVSPLQVAFRRKPRPVVRFFGTHHIASLRRRGINILYACPPEENEDVYKDSLTDQCSPGFSFQNETVSGYSIVKNLGVNSDLTPNHFCK